MNCVCILSNHVLAHERKERVYDTLPPADILLESLLHSRRYNDGDTFKLDLDGFEPENQLCVDFLCDALLRTMVVPTLAT